MNLSGQLRQAMKLVPAPVVVVSCSADGVKRGITCSSFQSISLAPPVISFSLRSPSRMASLLEKSDKFAVHLLSSHQVKQSMAFSSPQTQESFSDFPHYIDNSIPILQGCLSVLVCSTYQTVAIGDHLVWYGEVKEVLPDGIHREPATGAYKKHKPLLYHESEYRSIGDSAFMKSFEDLDLPFKEWSHRNHLRMAFLYSQSDIDLESKSDGVSAEGKAKTKLPNSYNLIKQGILSYNHENSHLIKQGFNETITVFFYKMVRVRIAEMLERRKSNTKEVSGDSPTTSPSQLDFLDFLANYPELDDFEFIFKFYSKELLYSDHARLEFVPPDLVADMYRL